MNSAPHNPTEKRGWYGRFNLADRAIYNFVTAESLRFADLDRNGHVNNVAFTIFFENARVRYLTDIVRVERSETVGSVLGHLSIDYSAQLYYPGNVAAACRIVDIRRTGLVLGQAIFRDDNAVATGHAVMVTIDHRTGRAVDMPAPLRARADELLRA